MDRAQLQGLLLETVSERRKMDIACRGTRHFIGLPGEVGSSVLRNFREDYFPATLDSLQTGFK